MNEQQQMERLQQGWGYRGQFTWQLPAVGIAFSGGLITVVFTFNIDPTVRELLLKAGAVFAVMLNIMLGQNIYYQTVAEDLVERIRSGEKVDADPIPRRKPKGTSYKDEFQHYFSLWGKVPSKTGSVMLALFIAGIPGFIAFLLSCDRQPPEGHLINCNYRWWWTVSLATMSTT